MMRIFLSLAVTLLFANHAYAQSISAPSVMQSHEQAQLEQRIIEAKNVFQEFTQLPESGVPRDHVDAARVILIIPNHVKGGFFYAGRFGLGVVLIFNEETQSWSSPAFIRISGGSFGLQAGVQWSDLILIGKGDATLLNFLQSRFSWGAHTSASAGPWGRHIEYNVDWPLKSSLFTYARSRGFFASVSLEGSVISFDETHNQIFYGPGITGSDVLYGNVFNRTRGAQSLVDTITQYQQRRYAQNASVAVSQNAMPVVPQNANVRPRVIAPQIYDEETQSILLVKNIQQNIKVYFDYNNMALRPDAAQVLDNAANMLRQSEDMSIVISGHTDIRGNADYNRQLGLKRAETVRDYLLDQGVRPNQIKIVSRGELDALAPPSDLEGMQRDRNAHFIIAQLQKTEMSQVPASSLQAESIGDNLYMTRQSLIMESDIKVATREYTVRPGDSLSSIARNELGATHRWKNIYALNMDRLSNPHDLIAGQAIRIPIE